MVGVELIIADAHPNPDVRPQVASTVVQALLTFQSNSAGLKGVWLGAIQERDQTEKPDRADTMLISGKCLYLLYGWTLSYIDWVTPQHLLDQMCTANFKEF